jgi:predicted Zn finger-like uncharacterized protein
MLVVCPNCATSYQVDPSALGSGRSVRCVRCQHTWFASSEETPAALAQSYRDDLAHFSGRGVDGGPGADGPPAGGADEAAFVPVPAGTEPETEYGWNVAQPPAAEPEGQSDAAPEPITVTDAPPLAPTDEPVAAAAEEPPLAEDIETVAARRARLDAERRRNRWLPGPVTTMLALLAVIAALIAWRNEVVRWLPQTASLYAALRLPVNLRALEFANVTTQKETQDGVTVLVVEGTIVSTAKRIVEVPRLRFAVRDEAGHEVYAWTALPAQSVLAPGETLAFRSRLASPPRESNDVLVRFFNRRDLVAGVP